MPTGRSRLGIALAFALVLSGCARGDRPAAAAEPGPISGLVNTVAGAVRGQVTPEYSHFEGIPYAAAATGERRWQPPQPVSPWPGVRDADHPGVRCVQDTARDPDYGLPTGEDCLNLNVWSPAGAAASPPAGAPAGAATGAAQPATRETNTEMRSNIRNVCFILPNLL